MKIKHTIELDGIELELEVYVLVTSWDSDDRGRPVIEDLEFEQIDYIDDNGKTVIAEGEIEQEILNLLDNDSDFASKIYAAAVEEGEDALAERTIQRAESAREANWEARRGKLMEECFDNFVRCGKTFVDVPLAEDWQYPARVKRIRIRDVAKYFAHESGSLSGGRSLAGIFGDWRMIDVIAQDVLEYFKQVNVKGMRKEARKLGLEPKF